MAKRAVLVQGGWIISMDPSMGEVLQGDVLIEDGKIARVAETIDAPEAELFDASMIVLPGFVDTHRHT